MLAFLFDVKNALKQEVGLLGDGFLKIIDLKKSFMSKRGKIDVLKGINLEVEKGDIYGVIGFSGAGKSTLIRCINRLEAPDSGQILIGGEDILTLDKSELRNRRKKMGMIFQGFNLFDSKTVFQNVEYPLKSDMKDRRQRRERVLKLIDLVGLADKAGDYPAQLSGGQKQRVGIARALANQPDILLSDEATSALDPQATLNVLDLLKDINQKLGITIILISHEIEVVKYACNYVAIIEDGYIREQGEVRTVLQSPMSDTGRIFTEVEEKLQDTWQRRKENYPDDVSNQLAR